jgi:hypothetical protein
MWVCLLRWCAGGAALGTRQQRRVHTNTAATEIATQELSFVAGEQLTDQQHGRLAATHTLSCTQAWLTVLLFYVLAWCATQSQPHPAMAAAHPTAAFPSTGLLRPPSR